MWGKSEVFREEMMGLMKYSRTRSIKQEQKLLSAKAGSYTVLFNSWS